MGRFTDESYLTYHANDDPLDFFTGDDGHSIYQDAEGYPCIESSDHTAGDEPVWAWTDDGYVTASMRCSNCGELLWEKVAQLGDPAFDKFGSAHFTAHVSVDGVDYSTDGLLLEPVSVAQVDPYIDENGRYVPGTQQHWELVWNGQTHYYVRDDLSDNPYLEVLLLSQLALSWFEFNSAGDEILRYTGPIELGSLNVIELPLYAPDSDTPLSSIGDGSYAFIETGSSPLSGTSWEITDRGSITRISSYTFRALQNLTLTLNAQGEDAIIELDNNAFYDCENTVLKCYHSSLLELGSHDDDTGKYTVEYLDEHTYYAKDAEFADDYSEAVLIIGCSNSYVPCQYEVRIEHASVTITPDPDNTDGLLATASVIYEGEEYSLTASVESCLIEVSYSNGTAMGHSSFRVPKARGKDYAKFTFASLELTDVIIPLGTSFTGWTGNGATYGPDDVITVTGDSASFSAEWESTWDAVREALLDETGVAVYLYNSIQAGVDDLPLYVPEGADSALILRGYDVDRNLGAAADDGYVIRTDGTLYINQNPNITNEEGEHHTGGVVKGGKNSGNGGGIYVGGTGVLNAESISVDGNTSGGNGGGIYLDDGASAELNAVTVNENTAASHGAGVFVNGTLNAAGTDFYRNIASSGNGGGIYIADGCFVTLNGCKVQYNRAPAGWGGGILVGGGYGIDSGSVPGGGTIEGEGQAKGLRSASLREISYNLTFISTSIEYNYAGMGAGGIFVENGTVQIGNGDRIINNEGPNETWDNCDVNNNASNQSPFELGNGITDLTMGIKMGLAGAAGGAAGGFFSGVAGWVSSMIGAAAAIGITITIGWFILDRSKSNGESSQAFPDCNHPKDKLLTYSQWEEDYYSHVKESTICTQCWTLQSNSELIPEQSVNETSQVTEYKVTLPDGTVQKRYVNPYTVVITPGITGLEHLAQTVRFPHGRHQTEVHVLPTEVPWEGIEGYQFVGWVPVNGSSTITSVDLGDGGHNDDDTETVVGKWKVSITYDSGALLPESVTIAGESPLQPNPSFVDVGTNHTLLPNTWKRGLILYDGDVTYSAYVFDGWDVYSGNFVDKMLTLRWVLETATGLPGMSAGETVPVTKPLKVEARWKSVWTIMGLALNTAGYFYLPADAFAVELDSGITVEAMEGGAETVLDLNGHMADASYVSLTTTPFTVEGKLKITDTSDNKGGVISGGKNPLGAGGGILVKGGASLTMEDGITIEDNYCYSPSESEYETWFDDNGGGVMVQGHFLMEGGSIKDNGTSNSGGGVYIDEGATFRMTGGEIKDNLARIHYKDPSTQGGGVYVNGTFEVSGKVVIQDNKLSHELETDPDDINNVYLPSGKLIKVVGALDPEASIGVSMEEPGVITSGLKGNAGSDAWGSADNFTSDDDDYIVIINADGEAELIEKPATITIKGVSGSFNDKIKLNYYFELPEEVLSDQGAYVTITQAVESGENSGSGTNNGSGTAGAGVGQNLKLYVKDLTADDYVEGKGYKFSISLAAKEAGDTITAKAYNGKGHPLFIRGNLRDNDYTETGVQYSLMEYFDWLQKEGTGNEKKVGLAAMDYCAAASIYFDYNAKDLEVSSAVTDMSKETMDELVDNYKATRSGSLPEGVGIKGISAMLESDNTLRLYYGFKKNVDPTDFNCYIDVSENEMTDENKVALIQRSDGAFYLALSNGVYSNHLQDMHTYTISGGEKNYTITMSVLTYARSCAIKSDETTSNLGKALYLYNRAAVEAFGDGN